MRVSGTVMGRAMPSGGLSAIATELLVQRSFGIVDRNWYLCAEAEPLWGTSDEEFEAGAIVREAREEAGFDLEDRDFTWNNGRPMRTVDKDRNRREERSVFLFEDLERMCGSQEIAFFYG
jgi:hypothetical protein